jgi:hypothetical protein
MKAWLLVALSACLPPAAHEETTPSATPQTTARADSCRDDIPDCAAACALRETGRRDYLDFYDRRCAAVILGKNPEKIANAETAAPPATASAHGEFPPDTRASLMLPPHAPFDPTSMSRTGGGDPAECKAARILRQQHREREADMLDAMCIAKGGGDAGL